NEIKELQVNVVNFTEEDKIMNFAADINSAILKLDE
ncbi:hypothetical protein MNBD_GAMMA07-534, partial [hydrothermal vent metagenome]